MIKVKVKNLTTTKIIIKESKMKNVKQQDTPLFAISIGVVFMLIVTAVMSFAYFTARAQSETQTIQFGVLELDAIDGFALKNEENQHFTDSFYASRIHVPLALRCRFAFSRNRRDAE